MPFADICVDDRETCPNEWPVLFYQQDTHQTQEVRLRDRHGKPLDLSHHKVCLIAKETFLTSTLYINALATIVDVNEALVSVDLDCSDLFRPGLFLGEFVIIELPQEEASSSDGGDDGDDHCPPVEESSSSECPLEGSSSAEDSSGPSLESSSEESSSCASSDCAVASSSCDSSDCPEIPEDPPCDDNIVYRTRCYVEVAPNLSNPHFWKGAGGLLTIGEIRLGIRDKCREDNFLLDNVEFSDTEIAWAIRRPIEYWNETPPPLRPLYDATNFPYRYHWLNGVVGELLLMSAMHYERNRLRYSAAGLSVDDKDKAGYYDKAGQKLIDEYREWVERKKYSINVGLAFASTSIAAYGNGAYYGNSIG